MRVALMLDRFPVVSETFIETSAAGLVEHGCDVTVLARGRPGHNEPAQELRRQVLYLEDDLEPGSLEPRERVPLAPGRHDVLHAHFGTNALRWLFARRQAAAPFVVTFHGHDFSAEPRRHGPDLYAPLWETADAVTYGCEAARAALTELGCPPARLRALPMSVDVRSLVFSPRSLGDGEPLRIATVARLVEKKGHALALRALAERREDLPPFLYEIVGDGPLRGRIAQLVQELGLTDVVRLHGACGGDGVRRVLADSHLFVLPSRVADDGDSEGAPVSLLEAQACGLPVIATRHGGIPEAVVHGESGLLVAENDVAALGDALVRLAADPESWPALGSAGRAHVESHYDVAGCTRTLLAIYEDVVEDRTRVANHARP